MISKTILDFTESKNGIVDNAFSKSIQNDIKCLQDYADAVVRDGVSPTVALTEYMGKASVAAQDFAKRTDFKDWNTSIYDAMPDLKAQAAAIEKANVASIAQSKSLSDARKIIAEYNNDCKNLNMSQQELVDVVNAANPTLGSYLKGLNGAKATLGGYASALVEATAKTIGLKVATSLLDAGVVAIVSLIINGLVAVADKLITTYSELKTTVDEVTTTYRNQQKTLSNNAKSLNELAPKYAKLSKGVDELGNNVSLTRDEYAEYQSITNQIADMFPTMVQGFNDQGTAILKCKGNVEELTAALEAETIAANNAIIANSKSIISKYKIDKEQLGEAGVIPINYQKDGKLSKSERDSLFSVVNSTDYQQAIDDLMYNFKSKDILGIVDVLEKQLNLKKKMFESDIDFIIRSIQEDTGGAIKALISTYDQQEAEVVSAQKDLVNAILGNALLSKDTSGQRVYSNISSEMGTALKSFFSQIDYDFIEENGLHDLEDINKFFGNLLSNINSLNSGDQASINAVFGLKTRFNNGDCSVEEYIDAINDANSVVSKLDPDVQKQLSVVLGLNDQEIQSQYDNLVDGLIKRGIKPEEAKEFVDGLNSEDFSIAVEFTTEFDRNRVEAELKRLQEGGNVDLLNRTVIDAKLLIDAGWKEAGEGAATVFTSTFANEAENLAANFTPIMLNDDGSLRYIFSPDALQTYAEGVLSGLPDTAGLQIGATFEGEKAIQEAEAAADRIHVLHEQYFADPEAFSLDAFYEQIKRWNEGVQALEAVSFSELIKDDPENDSDFADKINQAKEKFDELKEAREKLVSGELTSQEQSEIEYDLIIKYPNLGEFDNIVDGIDNEMVNLVGAVDATTGEATGLFAIFEEMAGVVQEKDIPLLNAFTQTILGMFSATEKTTPAFTSLKDAMEGVSDGASLYKKAQEEMEAGSLSPDTAASIAEALGGGEDAWKHFAVTANGELQLTESGFEQLKQTVFENLDAMTNAPDGFIDAMKNLFGVIITGAEETKTPVENLSDALKELNSVSSYLGNIKSGDITFVEAFETAANLLEDMNKNRPEGVTAYTLNDFFSFDENGNVQYGTDFIDKWIDNAVTNMVNDYVSAMNLANDPNITTELIEGFKANATAALQESYALDTLTSSLSKVSGASQTLLDIQEEIATTGKSSIDSITSLFSTFGTDAVQMLKLDSDNIIIDAEKVKAAYQKEIENIFASDEFKDNSEIQKVKDALIESLNIQFDENELKFEGLQDAMSKAKQIASIAADAQEEITYDAVQELGDAIGVSFEDYIEKDAAGNYVKASVGKLKEYAKALLVAKDASEAALVEFEEMWEAAIKGATEATTAAEELTNALDTVSTVSSYLTDIESGDINFIDALKTSMDLIEQMNKDLPDGAKKYSFSDFFTFDDAGNVKYETDFLNSWIESWIDGLSIEGLDDKMKEQMKNAAKAAAEEEDILETLTSTMDKVTSASSLLAQAQEEMAESGKVSVDTIKSLYDMFGTEAANLIKFSIDGSPSIDQEAIKEKIYGEIDEAFGADSQMSKILKLELDVQMEQEALDDTVDNYMSNVQTLQDAFDQLLSGEFKDSDLATLLREFPELRDNTDDLAGGIKELIGQMNEKTIEAFNKAIENAETDEAKKNLEAYKDAVLALGKAVGAVDDSIKIDVEIEGIEKLWTAISEANSAAGLSEESIKALQARYGEFFHLLGSDQALFERTAHGVDLNRDAFEKLEAEYQKGIKSKLDSKLKDLEKKFGDLTESIENTTDAEKKLEWEKQRKDIVDQMKAVANLRSQYDALTSAFYRWEQAQSSSNPRDKYEGVAGGYEEMKKLFEGGWYGDDSLQAYLDVMLGDANRDVQQTIADWKRLTQTITGTKHSIMDYFEVDDDGNLDTDGLFDFLDDIEKLFPNQNIAGKNEDGYFFNFTPENIKLISETIGLGEEAIAMMAEALIDTGMVVSMYDDYTQKILGYEQAIDKTQLSIKNFAEANKSLDLDAGLFDEDIFKMSAEELSEYREALEKERQKVLDSNLTQDQKDLRGNQYQSLINAVDRQIATIQIDAKIKDGKTAEELLGIEDDEALATELEIDMDQVEEAREVLEDLSKEAKEAVVTVKLDEEQLEKLIENKDPVEVEAEAIGEESVDELNEAIDDVKDKEVELEAKVVGTNLVEELKTLWDSIEDKEVTLKANVDKSVSSSSSSSGTGDGATGDGGATGTAYAQGNWGTKGSGMALGGELGRELLVRDGKYYTIGDHSAEFFQYKKGDIIFNHRQTEEILKHGRILSGQKRGRAFANGNISYELNGTSLEEQIANALSGGSEYGYEGSGSDRKPNSSKKKSGGGNGSGSGGGSSDDFKEIFDWIEVAIDRIERKIKNLDLKASSIYRTWKERNESLKEQMAEVTKEIELQTQGYERYMQEANSVGLDESWAEKVRNGTIDIDTVKDEKLAEKIKEYQEWYEKALDCKDAIDELNESLSELYKTAFDNVVAQYEGILGIVEQEKNLIEEYIAQTEAKGYLVSTKYYQALIENERSNIQELQKERTELINALNEAVSSGAIAEGSEAWYEMQTEINDVTLAIEEANTAILEYTNSIREAEWELFDKLQEQIAHIGEEAEFLLDLMSNNKLYDDDGQLTDDGMATMGLHGMNYNLYMQQAKEYAQEMRKINEELENDPYNQNLVDRKQELLELQQESILAAEDEKQAIRDMVEEGIETELDALSELIESYKEALRAEKDLYDYQKKVSKQATEIANIEKQLSAYAGDMSEEARLKIQQLKVSLEENQEKLEEMEYDKYISDQEELLDNLYEEYEEVLNRRLDDIGKLIEDMIAYINDNSNLIADTISDKASEVGYVLTKQLDSIWNNTNSSVVTIYDHGIAKTETTLISTIKELIDTMQDMMNELDSQAQQQVSGVGTVIQGYSSGIKRISRNELAWTQENHQNGVIIRPSDGAVLTPLMKDDTVLNPYATRNLFDLTNDPAGFIKNNLGIGNLDDAMNRRNALVSTFDNKFNFQINLPNVQNYEQFKYAMQHDQGFEDMVRAMTVDKMFGGSSLKKYKF